MMTFQEVSLTPGSQEKHVLTGDFHLLRNDFNPDFVQTEVIKVPAPLPADRKSIVAWVVPEGKTARIIHPTHQEITLKSGHYFSQLQVEYSELEGIQDAWD